MALQQVAPAACDLGGDAVIGASKWIFNGNGTYEWQLQALRPYMNASYAFRSHAVGTVDDSRYAQLPSYALVNLAAGLRGDLGDGQ